MEQKKVFHIQSHHPCTMALIDVLKDGKPGQEYTNDQLESISGDNIEDHLGRLYSAIRYCVNHHRVLWQRVRGERKIVCLNDAEVLGTTKSDIKKVCKLSSRSQRKLYIVDKSQLSPDQLKDLQSTGLQLGMFRLFGNKRVKQQLLSNNSSKLPKLEDLRKIF